MATFKTPCHHCGALLERSARACPSCSSRRPFSEQCPACLAPVTLNQRVCAACARDLYVPCPDCGKETFAGEYCQVCGAPLMVTCSNSRCGEPQFFANARCTACGHKIKPSRKK